MANPFDQFDENPFNQFDEAAANAMSQAQPILREGRREGGPFDLVPDPASGRLLTVPVKPPESTNFWTSTMTAVPADPGTQMRVLARSLFPDDPNAEQRVGVFNGRPAYVDDAGQLRHVSGQGINLLANIAVNTPEMIGGAVGAATPFPVSGSAAGAAGMRALKRGASAYFFDEPVTPGSLATEVATEAGLNLLTGLTGKLGANVAMRGKVVKDFSPANLQRAEQTREYIKRSTGIDLDLAQASGDAQLIALRNFAARYPGKSAELIQAANETSLGQFDQATNRVLDLVAKAGPSEFLGQRGVNAATLAIKAAREKVYNQVRPMYDAAYAAVPEVKDAAILDMLKQPHFPEAFKRGQVIAALEGKAAPKGAERTVTYTREKTPAGFYKSKENVVEKTVTKPDLRSLDYTKRALDDKIESLVDAGKRQEARALKMRRDQFVAAVDAIPNQQWQQARQSYAELINRDVMPLEDGAVGVLAKVKFAKNATAAARVLSDPNMTVGEIALVKDALSRQEPEAYRGLVRQWLGQQYNAALKETQRGAVVNAAGKFRQRVIGTPEARDRAKAMLPADATQAFDDLMLAAEKLASAPIGGSDTASNLQITDQLKRNALGKMRWLTSPIATTKGAIKDAAEQRAIDDGLRSLSEALVDPGKRSQLRQIVQIKDPTRQLVQLSTFLGQIGAASAGVAADDETRLPPAIQRLREAMAR